MFATLEPQKWNPGYIYIYISLKHSITIEGSSNECLQASATHTHTHPHTPTHTSEEAIDMCSHTYLKSPARPSLARAAQKRAEKPGRYAVLGGAAPGKEPALCLSLLATPKEKESERGKEGNGSLSVERGRHGAQDCSTSCRTCHGTY